MKKIFAFLLCAIFMLSLVGCDSDLLSIDDCTWELSSALNLNDKGEMTHGSKETVSAFGEGAEIICVMYADNGKLTINDKTNDVSYSGTYRQINTSPDSRYYKLNINDSEGSIVTGLTSYADGSSSKTLIINIGNYTLTFYELKTKE